MIIIIIIIYAPQVPLQSSRITFDYLIIAKSIFISRSFPALSTLQDFSDVTRAQWSEKQPGGINHVKKLRRYISGLASTRGFPSFSSFSAENAV